MQSRHVSRRSFIGASAVAAVSAHAAGLPGRPAKPVPLIHQTDLFRPHMDPDDHFDLACAYGLALSGRVRLLGVLCDASPPGHSGDPDIAAVAMLNHLTALNVPLVVGSSAGPMGRRDSMASASAAEMRGVMWLLDTLRRSPEPACITVVGSCRDVAVASRRDPALFARKCRGIYLNAGTGTPDPRSGDELEYNVGLDPGSYASMFDVPCPLYWMPCFERLGKDARDAWSVHTHGTYYRFTMREVLEGLAAPMQRFFLSMLEQESGSRWLRSLNEPVATDLLAKWCAQPRNMWCTAAFLHLAGMDSASAPYRFAPIRVECGDDGRTRWQSGAGRPPRWKFEISDRHGYQAEMTAALRRMMGPIGRQLKNV